MNPHKPELVDRAIRYLGDQANRAKVEVIGGVLVAALDIAYLVEGEIDAPKFFIGAVAGTAAVASVVDGLRRVSQLPTQL